MPPTKPNLGIDCPSCGGHLPAGSAGSCPFCGTATPLTQPSDADRADEFEADAATELERRVAHADAHAASSVPGSPAPDDASDEKSKSKDK